MTECGVAEKIALFMESCLGCPAEDEDCPLNFPLMKAQRKLNEIKQILIEDEKRNGVWTTMNSTRRIKEILEG